MQNNSPAYSRQPSSLLRYEVSDVENSSGESCSPKWHGWGGKSKVNFIPYWSDSSTMGDNNLCARENFDFSHGVDNSNIKWHKYFENSQPIPLWSDSSKEISSSTPDGSEKEVKLRNSDDYEIHTITEESEQVTQTDIKAMTPSSFSSKPITPNKRYSSHKSNESTRQPSQRTQDVVFSEENPCSTNKFIEKLSALNNQPNSAAHIMDLTNHQNYKNESMFNIPEKLKQWLKKTKKPSKLK